MSIKKGLPNIGNSCYINAVAQSLFTSKIFMERLELRKKQKESGILYNLYNKMDESSVTEVLNIINFDDNQQKDANEFLFLLIDKLHEKVKQLFFHSRIGKRMCLKCKKVSEPIKEEGNVFLVNPDLTVEYNGAKKKIQNLESYLKTIEGDVEGFECEECKDKGVKLSKSSLTKLSLIIPVVFKKYDNKKIAHFPEQLVFNTSGDKKAVYNLFAQVEHIGTDDNGHYIAICKRGEFWYKFDDKKVARVKNYKPSRNTYMIFYERTSIE